MNAHANITTADTRPEPQPLRHAVYALIFLEGGKIFVGRSPDRGLKGQWVVPGGKVEPYEFKIKANPFTAALHREVREEGELEINLLSDQPISEVNFDAYLGPINAKFYAAKPSIFGTFPWNTPEIKGWAKRTIPELLADETTSVGLRDALTQMAIRHQNGEFKNIPLLQTQ